MPHTDVKPEVLRKYFHLPIQTVAGELGICATMLKKVCRSHGIRRWPHRKAGYNNSDAMDLICKARFLQIQSLNNTILQLEKALAKPDLRDEERQIRLEELAIIQAKKKLITDDPNAEINIGAHRSSLPGATEEAVQSTPPTHLRGRRKRRRKRRKIQSDSSFSSSPSSPSPSLTRVQRPQASVTPVVPVAQNALQILAEATEDGQDFTEASKQRFPFLKPLTEVLKYSDEHLENYRNNGKTVHLFFKELPMPPKPEEASG